MVGSTGSAALDPTPICREFDSDVRSRPFPSVRIPPLSFGPRVLRPGADKRAAFFARLLETHLIFEMFPFALGVVRVVTNFGDMVLLGEARIFGETL